MNHQNETVLSKFNNSKRIGEKMFSILPKVYDTIWMA